VIQKSTLLEDKDCVQVLIAEYGLVKGEMKTYIDLFHHSTNFVTIYASFLAGVGGLLISVSAKIGTVPKALLATLYLHFLPPVHVYELLSFAGYMIVVIIGFSFVAAMLSYIYVIEVLAARAGVIERKINILADRDLLAWEIAISPQLIRNFVRKGTWISPSILRIGSNLMVLIVVLFVEALTAKFAMGSLSPIFLFFLAAMTIFYSIQGVAYRTVALPLISKVVEHESAPRSLSGGHRQEH